MSQAAIKAKPALYRFSGSEWHWVWLPELAEVIGWRSESILETFRDLAKDLYDGREPLKVGALHWRDVSGEFCCQEGPHREPSHDHIYVPAGFSNDVIQVREWGVVRLKRIVHGSIEPLDGTLREFYIKPDPQEPHKNRMAIVGLTHPTIDSLRVHAPLRKRFPLLH